MDIKKGDRLEYLGVECEVLWTHKPQGKAPTTVLLAEVVDTLDDDDEPTGRFTYGERYRVTKAELAGEGCEVDESVEPPHWLEFLGVSEEVANLLETIDDAIELGEAGLIKLKGVGKATAAKILEAAGA